MATAVSAKAATDAPERRSSRHEPHLSESRLEPLTRPDAGWTGKDVAIYLATLSPFVLLFVGAAIGWTIAPLEHLRPTPQNVAAGTAKFVLGLMIVRSRWGTRHRGWRSRVVVPVFVWAD